MDGTFGPKSNSTVTITALATSIVTNSSADFGCSGAGAGGAAAVRTGGCCLGGSLVPQPKHTSNATNANCRQLPATVSASLSNVGIRAFFDMGVQVNVQRSRNGGTTGYTGHTGKMGNETVVLSLCAPWFIPSITKYQTHCRKGNRTGQTRGQVIVCRIRPPIH